MMVLSGSGYGMANIREDTKHQNKCVTPHDFILLIALVIVVMVLLVNCAVGSNDTCC